MRPGPPDGAFLAGTGATGRGGRTAGRVIVAPRVLKIEREAAVRLWLHRQGLDRPRGAARLDSGSFVAHLERVGALQVDSVNAVDRAHYLTLWSRFGTYDRADVDAWVYRDRVAYEYWGHEASILPISHLPLGRRRMRGFPPEAWSGASWWPRYQTSTASKRHVLRRLRNEGPLESSAFRRRSEDTVNPLPGWAQNPPPEDKRSLKVLWHDGRVAISSRRHFRCLYDIAERIYPEGPTASRIAYEDHWLNVGLSGNGVVSEAHLENYFTAPQPRAADRRRIIKRALRQKRILRATVEGVPDPCYVLPEHVDLLSELPAPEGTTLICPFDSFLWQRRRAAELLDFDYRIEIYVPAAKRVFGYYVLPILHRGRLVGRLDPKLHRDKGELEIRSVFTEDGFKPDADFERGVREALESLAEFLGAGRISVPREWRRLG